MHNITIKEKGIQKLLGKEDASFLSIQDKETYIESGSVKRGTIFKCYSMTKPVTACAVMQLIENGVVKLDDPVSKYIESFKDATIQDLLNMESGLGYDRDNPSVKEVYNHIDELDTVKFAKEIGKCDRPFKSKWAYGVDADILGAVVEVATKQRYADYLEHNIFRPLKMSDSYFVVPKEKRSRIYKTDTGTYLGIKDDGSENEFHSGGAGLFSTIDDYAKFAQSFFSHKILSKETIEYMTTAYTKKKPFVGWEGFNRYRYGNLLKISKGFDISNEGEYGWFGWMGTFWVNDPSTNTTLLLMMNKRNGEQSKLPQEIRKLIFT